MANINDAFPSRYLKAGDLQGRDWTLTIERVDFEAMGRLREIKPVLYFVGRPKGLKLNKTMATAVAAIANTAETDSWRGVVVCLFATSADFGQQTYPVVRVKAPAGRRPLAPVPVVVDELDIDLQDSEVPF